MSIHNKITKILILLYNFNIILCQPILGNIHTSTPVAVKNKDFTFYASLTWGINIEQNKDVYWRLYNSNEENNILYNGTFQQIDENGALLQEFDYDLAVDKLGKQRYLVEVSYDNLFQKETTSRSSFTVKVVPGAVTLIPPIVTVIFAATTRNVLLSLYAGIYFAALIIWNYNPFYAFINSFSDLIIVSFSDTDHIFIVVFTWILSGMIACVMKSGGGEGLVGTLAKYAKSPKSGMLVAFALGLMIFFDDYANTLIVGQTVRPIIDSLGVSREKLAFLVDSTAAPVASVSPISSWIGFELSLIEDALAQLESDGQDISCYDSSAFIIFLNTIPGRFYPIFVLGVQFFLIMLGIEFGPMLQFERKARAQHAETVNDVPFDPVNQLEHMRNNSKEVMFNPMYHTRHDRLSINSEKGDQQAAAHAGAPELEPDPTTPRRWYNAVIPIAVTIILVLITLICTGLTGIRKGTDSLNVQNIFANSNSFTSLLYGSIGGTMTIWFMCWAERVTEDGQLTTVFHEDGRKKSSRPLISLNDNLEVFIFGIKNLVNALLILILAWTVGDSFTKCGTGIYISSALEDSVDTGAYPALTFVISAILALVTGSSWGTMSIMFPLILPAAHYSDPCNKVVFYGTISSILAGAVFGDHCSPISDTTVLASVSTKCELMNHVKSQLPYSVLAAVIGVLVGNLPIGYEAYPDVVGIFIGLVTICVVTYFLSAKIDSNEKDKLTLFSEWLAEKTGKRTPKYHPLLDEDKKSEI